LSESGGRCESRESKCKTHVHVELENLRMKSNIVCEFVQSSIRISQEAYDIPGQSCKY